MAIDLPQELIEIKIAERLAVFAAPENGGIQPFIDKIKAQVAAFEPDLSTDRSRKEIASLARKIASSKTYLDEVGKELTTEQKKIPNLIDASRRYMRDELDKLRDQIRKPLDDWEEAEKLRVAVHELAITKLREAGVSGPDSSASILRNVLEAIEDYELSEEACAEYLTDYALAKDGAIRTLRERIGKRETLEAEQAELLRLRREAEEREAKDAADRARQAEIDREARIADEQQAAQERAAREATERAEHEARTKADTERAEAAIRERQLVADREAAEQRAIQAEADARAKLAAEQAEAERFTKAREENKRHRGTINRKIVAALIERLGSHGVNEELAKAFVLAVVNGQIPNTTINY